eukprot:gnl/TRDRNA2_/TRDRNA2_204530_c0_seq1.p1 gnl/TRDRNA2_/TRDRNA2_204530_c0~~gnl/TRDRNA2_/TRDRNA2_204530_c0_seq1.p1  ORF type:complete len:301 (-),score=20.97 gnl/TRDRNA2_/TRDRNA2_204530_c0_seq1:129-1031(-)
MSQPVPGELVAHGRQVVLQPGNAQQALLHAPHFAATMATPSQPQMAGVLAAPVQQQFSHDQQLPLYAQVLNQHERLQIRQQRQWIEALTGLERNNRYVIRDVAGRDTFFVQENSSCIERNCCHGSCKAWRMDVFLIGAGGLDAGVGQMIHVMHIERPCTCTCLCMNRPEVILSDSEGVKLGSIREPFSCCNLPFTVHDASGTAVLETNVSCCQCGLCCPCPFQGCPGNKVGFDVHDISNGQEVAMVEKHWMCGDLCQCLNEWDNYWVHFGQAANARYKLLLLALSIFIQMRFFDRRNQQN